MGSGSETARKRPEVITGRLPQTSVVIAEVQATNCHLHTLKVPRLRGDFTTENHRENPESRFATVPDVTAAAQQDGKKWQCFSWMRLRSETGAAGSKPMPACCAHAFFIASKRLEKAIQIV
jgi:hypothetical protein